MMVSKDRTTTESAVAVRNMRLYDSPEGKYRAIPFILDIDWLDCIYIPASAGPTAAPTILMSMLVPSDNPMNCLGVDSMVTFIAPTFVNDKPVQRIARFADNDKVVEWNFLNLNVFGRVFATWSVGIFLGLDLQFHIQVSQQT
jgi:hypothetical protein